MFPNTNTKCLMRGCNYNYDCLNHIMQTCSYNYNNRIHRHNYVNSLLMSILNKHNYITILEPHIQTRNGLRKPDLIIYKNDNAYIIDTQISIDTKNTDINYTKKTNYYNTTDIIAYAKQITGANRIVFSASCWNWRGIPSALTTQDLLNLGLNKRDIELLSIRVIAGGLNIIEITAVVDYCNIHMLSWPLPCQHSFITLLFSYFVYNVNKWDNCNWFSSQPISENRWVGR